MLLLLIGSAILLTAGLDIDYLGLGSRVSDDLGYV